MIISELKQAITIIKTMLKELVTEEVLTADEAQLIAPVIITEAIKSEYIDLEIAE